MAERLATAVVCDHATGFRIMMETALALAGCLVVAATERQDDCIAAVRRYQPTVVVTELWLPDGHPGLMLVRQEAPTAVLAVVSPLSGDELAALLPAEAAVDLTLSKRERVDALARKILERWSAVHH